MNCIKCQSTDFDEENGLYFCRYCHTQSQGFTQQTDDGFLDVTKHKVHEVKKKIKRVVERKTGVLWTTTEGFNRILNKQMTDIFEFNSHSIDFKEFKAMTKLIWFSYLRQSGLAFTDGETDETKIITRRLHPASRFRDIQILMNRVDNVLPPFKNGSTDCGFQNLFTLGSDGVIRTLKELEQFEDYNCKRTEEQNECELFDIFYDRYRDPRNYLKIKSEPMKISKESRKQLNQIMSKTEALNDFELKIDSFSIHSTDSADNYSGSVLTDEEMAETKPLSKTNSPKSNVSVNSHDSSSLDNDSNYDDYDRELLRNLPKTTKLFSKYIPLSYLKKSCNISSDYFIDLMSLPKTLAILNLVFRLLRYDIYCFDLIRWANEGHIPYNNCLSCFPDDWVLICNDFMTFTSKLVPSPLKIHTLSTKIAKHIKINGFPRPDLKRLMFRFVKDLNLPKDIIDIINTNYNLLEHFPKYLVHTFNSRITQIMPFYERWVLMAIVLLLKRFFILNDTSEKHLSISAQNDPNLFIWNEWESYTQLRFELIRSYFIPFAHCNLEDIRDTDLIADHSSKFCDDRPFVGLNKNAPFRQIEFPTDVLQEFNELLFESESQPIESVKPSLYPITNATDFVLKRINSSTLSEKMSISFEDKTLRPWVCRHGKSFHRNYKDIETDPKQWSQSFKLLINLSAFVLNCRIEPLIKILKLMEKTYFG